MPKTIAEIQEECRKRAGGHTRTATIPQIPTSISIPDYASMSIPQLQELDRKARDWLTTNLTHPGIYQARIRHTLLMKILAEKAWALSESK